MNKLKITVGEIAAESEDVETAALKARIAQLEAKLELYRKKNRLEREYLIERERFSPDLREDYQPILRAVCETFELSEDDLTGQSKFKNVADARQVAMTLILETETTTTSRVGHLFGGRDHGTVCYARKAVANKCSVDPNFRALVDRVRAQLASKAQDERTKDLRPEPDGTCREGSRVPAGFHSGRPGRKRDGSSEPSSKISEDRIPCK